MTEDYSEQCVMMPGNAAGWAGLLARPHETRAQELTVKEDRGSDGMHHIRGFKPYETSTVVIEAGSYRVEIRAVADEHGRLKVAVEGRDVVTDPNDASLGIKVGKKGGICIRGQDVTRIDD